MFQKHLIKNLMWFILVCMIALNLNTLNVYAVPTTSTELTDGSGTQSTDPSKNPDFYKPTQSPTEPEVQEKAGIILGYVNTIGVVVSVITLIIIGIKYMLGSIEEKAEYKKTMIYYFIGAALLFAATTIPNILYNLTTGITKAV